MKPAEMLQDALISFNNDVTMVASMLKKHAPWYKRFVMNELQLYWLKNRSQVHFGLYRPVLKLCQEALEHSQAIDAYSLNVLTNTTELLKKKLVFFHCDEHLEVLHNAFLRSYKKYQKAVEDFNRSKNPAIS